MSIRRRFLSPLRDSRFIYALAMVLGLAFSDGAAHTEPTVVPALGLIMTLSILDISSRVFTDVRKVARPIAGTLVLNYIVLSGALILLSYLVFRGSDLHTGFVLLAAVPPAVAVIPFTSRLGGNTRLSLVGDVAAYIAALALTPLICIIFLGSAFIAPVAMLRVLAELIVAPLVLSRILRRTPIMRSVERWRGPVVNWSFFLVFYTIIGLNRDAFMQEPRDVLLVSAIAFATTFVLAELIDRAARRLGFTRADRISLMLLGTRKTYGLAGAIALVFFSTRAAMPAAVASAFSILHFMWLTWRVRGMR